MKKMRWYVLMFLVATRFSLATDSGHIRSTINGQDFGKALDVEEFTEYYEHVFGTPASDDMKATFLKRLSEGALTRDENPQSHFCVYFAAYDPEARSVFLGHHKKSGLWLFNGGHIDRGEVPSQAVSREMYEEWGLRVDLAVIGKPQLLTITEINNPTKQRCLRHYDIWYFVPVSQKTFMPSQAALAEEFHTTKWFGLDQALQQNFESNTMLALETIKKFCH